MLIEVIAMRGQFRGQRNQANDRIHVHFRLELAETSGDRRQIVTLLG